MKIYCEPNIPNFTITRIVGQIKETAPDGVEFVHHVRDADYRIILGIGTVDVLEAVQETPSILLQLCYFTGGTREAWDEIWKHVVMIGSYYYLNTKGVPYVRFPMGFDPEVFYIPEDKDNYRPYRCAVTGRVDGPEEIKAVHDGMGFVMHVGRDLKLGLGYMNKDQIDDDELRAVYQNSVYVAGLRRIEGFELPVVEGAACGCQPIVFDYECYRQWFDDFAIFINPDRDVATQLQEISTADERYRDPPDLTKFHPQNAWQPFWDMVASAV